MRSFPTCVLACAPLLLSSPTFAQTSAPDPSTAGPGSSTVLRGPYTGKFNSEDLAVSANVYAGYKAVGVVLSTAERGKRIGDTTNLYCQYVFTEGGKVALVGSFGLEPNTSSQDCDRDVAMTLQGGGDRALLTIERKGRTVEVPVANTGAWRSDPNPTSPSGVGVVGLEFGQSYPQVKDRLKAEGYEIDEADVKSSAGRLIFKSMLAFKPFAFPQLREICEKTRASGQRPVEALSIVFPYSETLADIRPLFMMRTFTPVPGQNLLSYDIKFKLKERYGALPTDGQSEMLWAYDRAGNQFQYENGSGSGRDYRQPRLVAKDKGGKVVRVIEGGQNACSYGQTRNFSVPTNIPIYSCNSDELKLDRSFGSTQGVNIPDNPNCAFSVRTSLGSQKFIESLTIQALSRDAAMNALNDIYYKTVDDMIDNTIGETKASQSASDFKL